MRRLLDMAQAGEIQARVGASFRLDEAADAHRALERREVIGKVVLTTA
jgi:NADPH2:quinone reductase